MVVELQNSKSDLKTKEASRLSKLGQEIDFAKILDSKCDIQFKITKIISNAINWKVDFNSYKSGKMSFKVPANPFVGG